MHLYSWYACSLPECTHKQLPRFEGTAGTLQLQLPPEHSAKAVIDLFDKGRD